MEVTGKLVHIFHTQVVSERFKKRAFVLEIAENPEYPETVQFEFQQDQTDLLNLYGVGQQVTIGFNLTGRAWEAKDGTTKYFNALQAWRIQKAEGVAPADTSDDLPF